MNMMLLVMPLLIVLGIALPLLGWLSQRQLKTNRDAKTAVLSIRDIVIQIAIVQTIVGCLALLALYGIKPALTWYSTISIQTILASVVALAGILLLSLLEARRPLAPHEHVRAELRRVSVRDPMWIGVTLYAGLVEEFAYRGVLTLLLAIWLGYWPAALISALLFALAHLSSGWRAVPQGVVFAMAMQLLVYLSGGLLLAVIVHAAYDLLAAYFGQKLARQRYDQPID